MFNLSAILPISPLGTPRVLAMAIAPEQVILFSGAAARRRFVSNEYCSSVRGETFFMKGWALNNFWLTEFFSTVDE
jgi:hypothetical protein